MANGDIESSPYKIKTFVFFDLETLSFNEYKPRILELSMIAVSREHFRSMKDQAHRNNPFYKKGDPLPLPRICHKFTTLYNPRKKICSVVEKLTGLSNNNLHHLKEFDIESAFSINLFLNLPSPVAFVAHNGNGFDFPILKAELNGVHEENLESIVCLDSLIFFRHFEKGDIKSMTEIAREFSLNDDEFLNEENDEDKDKPINDENNKDYKRPVNCCIAKNGIIEEYSSLKSEKFENISTCARSSAAFDSHPQNNSQIPKKIKTEDTLKSGYSEPSPKKITFDNIDEPVENFQIPPPPKIKKEESSTSPILPVRDKNSLPQPLGRGLSRTPPIMISENASGGAHNGDESRVRKANSFSIPAVPFTDLKKKPFSQPNIFYRIYGKKYFAHTAEADAEALLQICAYHGEDFISWADKNFIPFRKVKPRWR